MNRITTLFAVMLVLGLLVGCPGEKTNTTTNTYVVPLPVRILTSFMADAEEGTAYSVTIAATGGSGNYTWSLDPGGTNYAWLSVDANGLLGGNPTSTEVGAVTVVIRCADRENATLYDIKVLSFNVDAIPAVTLTVTTTSLPDAWTGVYYSEYLYADGGSGNYTWIRLPGGVNDGWFSFQSYGRMYGTPWGGSVGPVTLYVKVIDEDNPTDFAVATFNFIVYDSSLDIDNDDPLPNAAAGMTYSVQMTASGGTGNYVWNVEPGGTNDSWLSIGTSGILTGTAPATLGDVQVNVSVADTGRASLFTQEAFNLRIKNLAISTETLPDAFVGYAYSQAMTSVGGSGAITWTIEPGGANYSWLTMAGNMVQSSTNPTSNEVGSVVAIVQATDGTNTDARVFRFEVYETVTIDPLILGDAFVDVDYNQYVQTTDGSGDFSYSIQIGGSNDSWLSIDADTGLLTGTPSTLNLGAVSVIVKVEEKQNSSVFDQQTLTFDVLGISIINDSIPDADTLVAYSHTLTAIGGSGYYAWSITSGPAWMSINADTGELTGQPAAPAVCALTVYVYDPLNTALNDTKTFNFWAVTQHLFENFDSGTGTPSGWSCSGFTAYYRHRNSTSYLRYRGPHHAKSGNNVLITSGTSYYSGQYNLGSYHATTPTLNFSAAGVPILEFWTWHQFEQVNSTNDGGVIEITTNGGASWVQLTPSFPPAGTAGGYPAFVGYGVHQDMTDYDVYPGDTDSWRKAYVNLSSYAGNTVQIRFNVFSMDGDSEYCRGWAIDDVSIYEIGTTTPLPRSECSKPFPGDTWTYAPPESGDFASGITLQWDGVIPAATYDVYLGASQAAVAAATTASAEHMVNQAGVTYTSTALTAGNTYFWRVDARNSAGVVAGPVWEFTTSNPVPIVINEFNTYYSSSYGNNVELWNASSTVTQDISGYRLTMIRMVSGTVQYTDQFTIPQGVVIFPDKCKIFSETYNYYYNYYTTNWWPMMWDSVVMMDTHMHYVHSNYTHEIFLQDPSLVGEDYVASQLGSYTHHRPSDLSWSGDIGYSYYRHTLFRRMYATDNDSASDWVHYYYHYNGTSRHGYLGHKSTNQ